MRMRRRRHLDERVEQVSSALIKADLSIKDASKHVEWYLNFKELFGNDNPIYLEIGCGKGKFAIHTAKNNQDINLIAVDMISNVIIDGCNAAIEENLSNIKFLLTGAEYLGRYFPPNSVEKIFLNFSTPFQKKSYENRRLTHKRFLDIYRNILTDTGCIVQKTDNRDFFDFSVQSFKDNNFRLENVSYDIHGENKSELGGVITEYESKFIGLGEKICFLTAYPNKLSRVVFEK